MKTKKRTVLVNWSKRGVVGREGAGREGEEEARLSSHRRAFPASHHPRLRLCVIGFVAFSLYFAFIEFINGNYIVNNPSSIALSPLPFLAGAGIALLFVLS
jgi:hypothetical protein